ncbi:Hydroxyacylglutathione hydrolase [Metallosphaera sp. J1]|uniref:MBL fold metallo-hydrolase n=1 Tax=Metallosphaera TaxID=41980 RepID=UPI001EDFFA84|nr:MBL fold metallo-hydrolase [Metallosphaera javensis (ex Hofmann et al. 2022)]MCG3109601.1 Hydroxyacylglutathione hydrolase [Metallosphaera javensis (ex Hofmann et al. 2022)]BCS93106.1 MAG: MBL fold metallo-hydrolase [Metallosphaera javensis (ex Sakai et al. 2022)]
MIYEINLRFVKAFLLEVRGKLILVDSGTKGNGNRILNAVTSLGKDSRRIEAVIYTHSHGDHIGSAGELKIPRNLIHENGLRYLTNGIGRKPVLHSTALKIGFALMSPFFNARLSPVFGAETLKEGEVFPGIQVIYTPGHTDDSITLYMEDEEALLVGDMLQGTKKGLRLPSIYEDFELLRKSVEKVKQFRVKKVYVSHGISGPPRWPF